MARTSSIETPDELKTLQRLAHEQRDRYILGVVQAHKRLPSKIKKKDFANQSLFKLLAPYWRELTETEKDVWREAGVYSGISGWQLFISDNAARLKNDLELSVPPSDLWQVRAGRFVIQSPATEIILKQEHPQSYLILQKIVGTPWKKEMVTLTENFSLPLQLTIRYKSNLVPVSNGIPTGDEVNFALHEYIEPTGDEVNFALINYGGGNSRARYYAKVWTSYQGKDIYTDFNVELSENTDWTIGTITTSGLRGILIGYTLYFEIVGYTGELLFDNIRAVHGGTNWALDPRCDQINKQFTKSFALVPPFWVPVSLPEGAQFYSIFPPAIT